MIRGIQEWCTVSFNVENRWRAAKTHEGSDYKSELLNRILISKCSLVISSEERLLFFKNINEYVKRELKTASEALGSLSRPVMCSVVYK